jgi:hypothetical protein
MRITCWIDYLVSGGAQRQLCTLAVLLKRQGHDVSMVTYHPDDFFLPMLVVLAGSLAPKWLEMSAVIRPSPVLSPSLEGRSPRGLLCLYGPEP